VNAGGWLLAAVGAYGFVEVLTRGALIRLAWRELLRAFVLLELGSISAVRLVIRPRYELVGECQRRGECCKHIVGHPPGFIRNTRLLSIFVLFHRLLHNFRPVGRGPDGEVIFACDHLQTDGRCGIYRWRPFICRNYPVVPFFEPPGPLPGCGFSVRPRVVGRMQTRASLPILDGQTMVHHPTRDGGRDRFEQPEDYERVETPPAVSTDVPAAAKSHP